ncbi:serglycin [Hippocampus zosterae]|uniref:serglycin n=1 Tax=Hippocampus zosterae TaxID=109293 RepID=UPI00223DFB55|nr:serglycin [Hippocampus zosterae]
MAWTIFLAACCLIALHAEGAPRTAVYKFVKCRPEGNHANCVTQRSPQMEWSPDLPTKLPPSSAHYLDAQPVEQEGSGSMSEFDDVQPEDGSGYEGSAGSFWIDSSFDTNTEQEMGSGESLTDQYAGRTTSEAFRKFLDSSWRGQDKGAEREMQEEHFLQL